jgi:hypothetical protein
MHGHRRLAIRNIWTTSRHSLNQQRHQLGTCTIPGTDFIFTLSHACQLWYLGARRTDHEAGPRRYAGRHAGDHRHHRFRDPLLLVDRAAKPQIVQAYILYTRTDANRGGVSRVVRGNLWPVVPVHPRNRRKPSSVRRCRSRQSMRTFPRQSKTAETTRRSHQTMIATGCSSGRRRRSES